MASHSVPAFLANQLLWCISNSLGYIHAIVTPFLRRRTPSRACCIALYDGFVYRSTSKWCGSPRTPMDPRSKNIEWVLVVWSTSLFLVFYDHEAGRVLPRCIPPLCSCWWRLVLFEAASWRSRLRVLGTQDWVVGRLSPELSPGRLPGIPYALVWGSINPPSVNYSTEATRIRSWLQSSSYEKIMRFEGEFTSH